MARICGRLEFGWVDMRIHQGKILVNVIINWEKKMFWGNGFAHRLNSIL